MAEMITDKTMDEIEILAKLHLTEDEKEKSRQDLQQMLDYVDMLNQLDTSDVEPLTHIFPIKNVFREDVVLESTPKEELLKNAPKEKDGQIPLIIGNDKSVSRGIGLSRWLYVPASCWRRIRCSRRRRMRMR